MKFKVGQLVRFVQCDSFNDTEVPPIGTVGVVTKIIRLKDVMYPFHVSWFIDGNRSRYTWTYGKDELEAVDDA